MDNKKTFVSILLLLFFLVPQLTAAPETLSGAQNRVRIAVMGQEDFHPDRTVPGNVRSLPDDLAARIIENLSATNRFEVLERTALRRVVREQQFGRKKSPTDLDRVIEKSVESLPETSGWTIAAASAAADHNDRLKEFQDLGSTLGADYLVYAVLEQQRGSQKSTAVPFSERGRKVTENRVDARLRLRVIDTRQGRVVGAGSIRTRIAESVFSGREATQDEYSMFDHLGKQAAVRVLDMIFPARLVSDNPLVINRGSNEQVSVGDEYRVVREGPEIKDSSGIAIGKLRNEVGQVKVTQVQPTLAVVSVVKGDLKVNDLALPLRKADPAVSAPKTVVPLKRTTAAAVPGHKPRLAVGLVKAGSTARTGKLAAQHLPMFTDTLISRLTQTQRFQLIDRQETDQLLDEQLAQAMAANRDMPSAMGQLKSADYLVLGSVSSFVVKRVSSRLPGSNRTFVSYKGQVEGNMRVVDARTGDILESRKVSVAEALPENGTESQLISALADAYADQVTVNLMNAVYPIKVAAVVSGIAYINRGNDGGLVAGERLRVVRPGQPIIDPDTGVQMGNAEQELGELVLAEVEDARSKAPVGQLLLQRGDVLKRLPGQKGKRSSQAAAVVVPARTGGRAEQAGEGNTLTLAVGKVKINPGAHNRRLRDANVVRITNDLMVKLSQFPEFDVMERAEIAQVLDEKSFTAIAAGTSSTDTLRQLKGADYLVHAAIDDFMVRHERTKVPYTNEYQDRYFGTAEATVRMVDVHTGKLASAIKVRLDERLKQAGDNTMATNDMIDLLTKEVATRISDDLLARQNGTLVPQGRRKPKSSEERPAPPKVRRPNF